MEVAEITASWDLANGGMIHCKKRLAIFPARESLVSDIPAFTVYAL